MRIAFSRLASGGRRKVVIVSVLLSCLAISALSMSRWAAPRFGSAQGSASAERVRVLHFTLTPLGFNPSAMTVPEGLYVIEVTNRSDLSTFSLSLGQLAGHKLKEVDAARKHGEWRGFFRLKKDDFVLTVNEKIAWTARLQVIK